MSKVLRKEVSDTMPASGGMLDLFDMMVYSFYNITSDELDIITENATDEELNDFVNGMGGLETGATLSEIRKGILVRNKYVEYFNSK